MRAAKKAVSVPYRRRGFTHDEPLRCGPQWHATCLFLPMAPRSPKYRRWILALAVAAAPLPAADLQDIPQLERWRNPRGTAVARTHRQASLLVGPVEPHLRLDRCVSPVKPTIAAGAHMHDRVLVELRCQDNPGWHIYVRLDRRHLAGRDCGTCHCVGQRADGEGLHRRTTRHIAATPRVYG